MIAGRKPHLPAVIAVPHVPHCRKETRRMVIHSQNAVRMRHGKLYLAVHCTHPACEGLLLLPMEWVDNQLYLDWLGEIEK